MFRRKVTTQKIHGKRCIIHSFSLSVFLLASLLLLTGCGGADSYLEDTRIELADSEAGSIVDGAIVGSGDSENDLFISLDGEDIDFFELDESMGSVASENIVTTIFPLYDWTRVILGSNPGGLSVRYLLESGVDLHNYTPSIQDIASISASDLFLWIGGKSDDWVLNAMANPLNEERRNVPVMRLLTIHETQVFPLEGVIPGEVGGENCCGGATHDEHVWLSLPFAMRFVERIGEEIALLDPENASYYIANTNAYIAELYELHDRFIEMVENAARDTILVVDRFPFLYLTLDYGLNFFSAFDGCFAATEISLQRQAELANAVNNLGLDVIIIIDNLSVAESVASAVGRDVQIISLEDFQTVSGYHIEQGMTYLDGMRHNLEALWMALG